MKVAILSESSADEAAIEVLIAAILRLPMERMQLRRMPSRGWPSVLQNLPALIKELHYQTDADGLVVVADSNHSLPHRPAHDEARGNDDRCRFCLLRSAIERTITQLRPVASRGRLKVAMGLASPAIEAWYLCSENADKVSR